MTTPLQRQMELMADAERARDKLEKIETALEKWKMKASKEDTRWTYFIIDAISKGLGPDDAGCDAAVAKYDSTGQTPPIGKDDR